VVAVAVVEEHTSEAALANWRIFSAHLVGSSGG
jgi:hypothetical protein